MTVMLVGDSEVDVSEEVDAVLMAMQAAKDGVRGANGKIIVPPGWLVLTDSDSGEPIYVQISRVGYVR
ncbi:MAG: hypothetical protein ACYDHN_08600 [Solirubrobacteraceae bacterium]